MDIEENNNKRARSDDDDSAGTTLLPYPLAVDPNDSKFRGRGWKVVCTKHNKIIHRCTDPICRLAIWEFLKTK